MHWTTDQWKKFAVTLKDEGELWPWWTRYIAKGGQLLLPVAEGGRWWLENFSSCKSFAASEASILRLNVSNSDVMRHAVFPDHLFNTWDLMDAVCCEATLHSKALSPSSTSERKKGKKASKELKTLTQPLDLHWNVLHDFEILSSLQHLRWTISPSRVGSVSSDDFTWRRPEYWCGRWHVIHCDTLSVAS